MKKRKVLRKAFYLVLSLCMACGSTFSLAEGAGTQSGNGTNGIEIVNNSQTISQYLGEGEAGNVTGTENGILIENNSGTIDLSVNDVEGTSQDGIHIDSDNSQNSDPSQDHSSPEPGNTGTITISAENISGSDDGIEINNNTDPGNISITAENVSGGQDGVSIEFNSGSVEIIAESVTGGDNDSGTENNVEQGDVSYSADGVSIENNSGSVEITADSISGSENGVSIDDNSGSVEITAGSITGTEENGIYISQNKDTGNISLNSGTDDKPAEITGSAGIVVIENNGMIDLNADKITGTSIGHDGSDPNDDFVGYNYDGDGIFLAQNNGRIQLETGDVESKEKEGINITENNGTITMNLENDDPGNVTGKGDAVTIQGNNSSIELNLGNVTSTAEDGIQVSGNNAGGDAVGVINLNTSNIYADGYGVSISDNSGSLTMSAAAIQGNLGGIQLSNLEDSTVIIADSVNSAKGSGILIDKAESGSKTTITILEDVNETETDNTSSGLRIASLSEDAVVDVYVGGTIHKGDSAGTVAIDLSQVQNSNGIPDELTITAFSIEKDENGNISNNDEELKEHVNYILRVETFIGNVAQTIGNLFNFNIGGSVINENTRIVGKDSNGENQVVGYYTAQEGDLARMNIADVVEVDGIQYNVDVRKVTENEEQPTEIADNEAAGQDENGYYFTETVEKGGNWWLRVLLSAISSQKEESNTNPVKEKDQKNDDNQNNPDDNGQQADPLTKDKKTGR